MSVIKTPAECMMSVCSIGGGKPKMSLLNNLIMAFFAGAYIGFGSLLAIKTTGNLNPEIWGNFIRLAFGMVFPVGLLLVLVAGADLFTGNCMYMPSALMNKKSSWLGLIRSWVISYSGNLVGSIFVAYVLGTITGIMYTDAVNGSLPLVDTAVKLANMKCGLPWGEAFLRGIGCNWLVCLAIYVSLTASDGVSKVILIWPPIAAFVVLGFEHSVANMTFIPLGIFLGATETYLASANPVALTASWAGMVNNLIPVTLGNIVGGMFFVGMLYYKATNTKSEAK